MANKEEQKNAQHIGCKVESCRYNSNGCNCGLSSIDVAPCPGGSNGNAADESMCASYRCKS
jgi:hypothetical protein